MTRTFRGANARASPLLSRLSRSELVRKTTAEIMPIQCRIPSDRPTTDPARCRAGQDREGRLRHHGEKYQSAQPDDQREQHQET